jgi:hypothetical protein
VQAILPRTCGAECPQSEKSANIESVEIQYQSVLNISQQQQVRQQNVQIQDAHRAYVGENASTLTPVPLSPLPQAVISPAKERSCILAAESAQFTVNRLLSCCRSTSDYPQPGWWSASVR